MRVRIRQQFGGLKFTLSTEHVNLGMLSKFRE